MKKIRSGDMVVVIAGNDRGKSGKILRIMDDRATVEGINVRKKHKKKTQENQSSQIIAIECPVHISNLKPFVEGKAVTLRTEIEKGKKRLVYGEKGDLYREIKKPVKKG